MQLLKTMISKMELFSRNLKTMVINGRSRREKKRYWKCITTE
jgi:hypothetical protein